MKNRVDHYKQELNIGDIIVWSPATKYSSIRAGVITGFSPTNMPIVTQTHHGFQCLGCQVEKDVLVRTPHIMKINDLL